MVCTYIVSSPPVITMVTAIDFTSVRVEWNMPTNVNGMLTIYTITYNIEGGDNRTVNIPYNKQLVCNSIQLLCVLQFIFMHQTQSYDITELSPYQLVRVTITATNGGGTSDPSNEVIGRSSEAGNVLMLILAKYIQYIHACICLLPPIAPGLVENFGVVGTSNTTAIIFWTPPSQPNGVITGYQIIYYLYGDSRNSMNQAVGNDENSFIITNLSELINIRCIGIAMYTEMDPHIVSPQYLYMQYT